MDELSGVSLMNDTHAVSSSTKRMSVRRACLLTITLCEYPTFGFVTFSDAGRMIVLAGGLFHVPLCMCVRVFYV